jgi:hypothetical protein
MGSADRVLTLPIWTASFWEIVQSSIGFREELKEPSTAASSFASRSSSIPDHEHIRVFTYENETEEAAGIAATILESGQPRMVQ